MSASSFASAMFTWRNVFSYSFASSATRGEPQGMTVSHTCSNRSAVRRAHSGVTPETSLGVVCSVQPALLAGSTRSGA